MMLSEYFSSREKLEYYVLQIGCASLSQKLTSVISGRKYKKKNVLQVRRAAV